MKLGLKDSNRQRLQDETQACFIASPLKHEHYFYLPSEVHCILSTFTDSKFVSGYLKSELHL
jgi:hypothetical protein